MDKLSKPIVYSDPTMQAVLTLELLGNCRITRRGNSKPCMPLAVLSSAVHVGTCTAAGTPHVKRQYSKATSGPSGTTTSSHYLPSTPASAAGGAGGAAATAAGGDGALSSGIQRRHGAPVVMAAARNGVRRTAGAGAPIEPATVVARTTSTSNFSSGSTGPLPGHTSISSASSSKWGSSYDKGGSSRESNTRTCELDLDSVVEKCISAERAGASAGQDDDGFQSRRGCDVMATDASGTGTAGEASEVPPNTPCSSEFISSLTGPFPRYPFLYMILCIDSF